MAEVDLDKLRSVGFLSRGRTQSRSKSGRAHPESGKPYKVTRDENGHDVTEHGAAGSGLSDRQDVQINMETLHFGLGQVT